MTPAARADGNTDGFKKALTDRCKVNGIDGWRNFVSEGHDRQFFKDAHDADAQRVIAFWSELDEPLEF
ncbi:MAG: hypothetical protein ACKOEM_14510 [Planctomycetia bacterium]